MFETSKKDYEIIQLLNGFFNMLNPVPSSRRLAGTARRGRATATTTPSARASSSAESTTAPGTAHSTTAAQSQETCTAVFDLEFQSGYDLLQLERKSNIMNGLF